MSGKTNIDYHLENLPWIEQQVLREIYKAIGYYNSHGAQFESPTDVFYGIRTNVLKIVDAMNDPRAEGGHVVTLNQALDQLGKGASITYVGKEGGRWHCELRLPTERYTASLVTAHGATPDEAVQNTVDRALTFAQTKREVAA